MGFAPIVAAVAGVIGTAVSAVGMIQSGQAQAKSASYAAQVARNNALIADKNANYAIQSGNAQEQQTGMQDRALLGAVVSGEAASGLDVNTGTTAQVQQGQREIGKLDQDTIAHNAAMEAYGYRTQSMNFSAQSSLDKSQAAQAGPAGIAGAAGGLLSGASSLADKWDKLFPSTQTDVGGWSA